MISHRLDRKGIFAHRFCVKCFFLLFALWTQKFDVDAAVAKNSSPFDPFRLECPFFHGIIKLSLQRVESTEGVRSDVMVTSFCENIKKIYPSPRDAISGTADENCRWTNNLRIPGLPFDFTDTCSGKEFISGISRQEFGQYGVLCCKLRDRKRGECSRVEFVLPNEQAQNLEIGAGKRVLSSLGQENGRLTALFCDLELMSRQELDEEFVTEAKARLLSQVQVDKVRTVPDTRETDQTNELPHIPIRRPVPRPSTSKPSPPSFSPPSEFSQGRGAPGSQRSAPTPLVDNAKNKAKLSIDDRSKSVQKLATQSVDGPPAIRPPSGKPSPPSGKQPPPPGKSSQPSRKTPVISSSATSKSTPTSTKSTAKTTHSTESTPKKTSTTSQSTKTTEATPIVEPDVDSTPPDPAHFQVLGIPRPAPPPNPFLSQPSPLSEGSDKPGTVGGTVSAGGSNIKKSLALPPAPSVVHEATVASIDSGEQEKSSSNAPRASTLPSEDGEETTVGLEEPVPLSGTLGAESNGVVINPQNATVESAVAPAKPLYTILPPVPDFVVGSDRKPINEKSISTVIEDRKLSAVANLIPEPDVPTPAPQPTTTIPPPTTTTGAQRLECDTNSAWRDPISGLVMACGQGDEIWIPARCNNGLLCLLAKDSSYRLCCSVHIPS